MSKIEKEFQEFMSAESLPPRSLDLEVRAQILGRMNPTLSRVFAKLLLLHLVTGSITLLLCPQLGLGRDVLGLMRLFMVFGHAGCMVGCGGFFLGTSAIVASLLLSPEELVLVRRRSFVHFSILAAISLLALMAFGASIVSALSLFWLAGSVLGGSLMLEMGWRLRFASASA